MREQAGRSSRHDVTGATTGSTGESSAGKRTHTAGLAAPARPRGSTADPGAPVQLPDGFGAGASSAYGESRGEYLGFGADFGAGDLGERGVATLGVRGAAEPIPHLATVQSAFGRHDVSHARGHMDEAARTASDLLGAEAFATGSEVAFGSRAPSLHTVAHEMAHVAQQRPGVSRKTASASGLDHEQHADAVADAVVRGESAEVLLDAGPSAPLETVRKKAKGSGQRRIEISADEADDFAVKPPKRVDFAEEETEDFKSDVDGIVDVPPRRVEPRVASSILSGFILRPPVDGYMRQTRLTNVHRLSRGGGLRRAGEATGERVYSKHYAGLLRLKVAHEELRAMNHGKQLPGLSKADVAAADALTDDNREEGHLVTEDLNELQSTERNLAKVLPHAMDEAAHEFLAAIQHQRAVEAQIHRVEAGEKATGQAAKVKGLEADRDKTVRRIKGVFQFFGKLLKFASKAVERPFEAAGEALEGVGGLIGDWIVVGINKPEIEAARTELERLQGVVRALGDSALEREFGEWTARVQKGSSAMLEVAGKIDDAASRRRMQYKLLGKSVSNATAGRLPAGRRLGDHIRQVPLLEEFLSLAATLPTSKLRTVDNPIFVNENAGEEAFAAWALVHLPELADTIDALTSHYDKQRKDAMHLIAVIDR